MSLSTRYRVRSLELGLLRLLFHGGGNRRLVETVKEGVATPSGYHAEYRQYESCVTTNEQIGRRVLQKETVEDLLHHHVRLPGPHPRNVDCQIPKAFVIRYIQVATIEKQNDSVDTNGESRRTTQRVCIPAQ